MPTRGVSLSVKMDSKFVLVAGRNRSGVSAEVKDERLLFEYQTCVRLQERGQKNRVGVISWS